MTVTEAFQEFKTALELPERDVDKASAAQQSIRERVGKYLYVPASFLTGSYARHTKIYPLHDIDVFLVRNTSRTGLATNGSGILPNAAIEELARAIRTAYPLAVVKEQRRSVNLKPPELAFGFDLTPAWLRHPDGYWIPDRETGAWVPSDPEAHAQMMTGANTASNGMLKPLIKMAKHWSRNNYDRVCSFHMELISADIFRQHEVVNFQLGLARILVNLPTYISSTMMDPIYNHTKVNKDLSASETTELLARAQYDSQNALQALDLEQQGYHQNAIDKWKHIFISGFPN